VCVYYSTARRVVIRWTKCGSGRWPGVSDARRRDPSCRSCGSSPGSKVGPVGRRSLSFPPKGGGTTERHSET